MSFNSPASADKATSALAVNDFSQFTLLPQLNDRIATLGYQIPTPVQAQVIPAVMAGRDVQAKASTGSGKTAAFALPLLDMLAKSGGRDSSANWVSCLVLVPTRELAQQVADSFKSYGSELKGSIKTLAVYGGVSVNSQMLSLRGGCDVLVATPGRLLDLVSSNAVKLGRVKHLVLDEADRMLGLGFQEELQQILALIKQPKQSLLFSATFGEETQALTQALLNQPAKIEITDSEQPVSLVQRVITVNKVKKTQLLIHLLKENQWRQVLVFASAKNSCNKIQQKLEKAGISAQVFHSDKAQGARTRLMQGFKSGDIQVLIATDIAARGIDIEKLPVVINYELPRSPADYMHRIGRSGRAGESGLGLSLISHDEYHHFKVIEKKNKLKLQREQIVGFEADKEAPLDCPSRQAKPQAKPAGTGKKHRKKQAQVNAEVWGKK